MAICLVKVQLLYPRYIPHSLIQTVLFFYDVLLPMVIASMMLFSLDSIVSVVAFFLGITEYYARCLVIIL